MSDPIQRLIDAGRWAHQSGIGVSATIMALCLLQLKAGGESLVSPSQLDFWAGAWGLTLVLGVALGFGIQLFNYWSIRRVGEIMLDHNDKVASSAIVRWRGWARRCMGASLVCLVIGSCLSLLLWLRSG